MATQKVDFDVLAHDKASDKLDRISRAFRKLKNDSDNIDGDGLADLSKKLRKVADDFEKEGNKSGKKFGSGLKKWVTGDGKGIGGDFGTVFGSGFLGMLKTPVLGPALLAAIGTTVATVMPAVGAIAGAGLVAGFGAGIAGLGVVFAAKSVAVKNSWNRTLHSMASDMKVLSKPFEATLLSMSGVARRTFARFKPELDEAFKTLAPSLTEFGDSLGRAFEKLAPAIRPLSEAFAHVLKSLGPATQAAIHNISRGLQDLAQSVKNSPDGLADLVKGFGELTQNLLDGISTLNNINGAFEKLTGGVSLVDGVMKGLNFAVDQVFGPFRALEAAMEKVGIKTREMNSAVDISADTMKLWLPGMTAAQIAAVGTGNAIDPLTTKVESLATKFERQKRATDGLIESLFRLQGLALTLSGAQINLQAAIDAATASVKENGKSLNINTEKGRANKTALDAVARSANEQTEAMLRSGKGNVAAYTTAATARANFVRLAQQMGATKPQAEAMARSMIAIPNVTREARLKANKADLDAKLAKAKTQLADKNLTKERRAQLNADIKKLQAAVNAAQAKINSLRGKTVTNSVVTIFSSKGVALNTPSGVGRRAHGGPVKKGEPYVVGEDGPELMVPNHNGTIIPNSRTKSGGAPSGSTGAVNLTVNVNGARDPRAVADQVVAVLRKFVRINGGDVQAVLGQ